VADHPAALDRQRLNAESEVDRIGVARKDSTGCVYCTAAVVRRPARVTSTLSGSTGRFNFSALSRI
jgi:hypothetical protein